MSYTEIVVGLDGYRDRWLAVLLRDAAFAEARVFATPDDHRGDPSDPNGPGEPAVVPAPAAIEQPLQVVQSIVQAIQTLYTFATGTAKPHQEGTPAQIEDMKHAPGVEIARALFVSGGCEDISGFPGSFGALGGAALGESVRAPWGGYLYGQDGQFVNVSPFGIVPNPTLAANPTRQIIGSYRLNVDNNGDGTTLFSITNTMSFNSLTYHAGNNRPNGSPWGNTMMHVWWNEPTPCH